MLGLKKKTILGKIKKKKGSLLFKPRLLKKFNHPVYVRFQHNNLFMTTKDIVKNNLYHFSVGRLEDYKHKKKKKKTYMAGFELGHQTQNRLVQQQVLTLHLYVRGTGAHFRGFYDGITRHKRVRVSRIENRTPVAHNGTRGERRRRL